MTEDTKEGFLKGVQTEDQWIEVQMEDRLIGLWIGDF